MYKEIILACFKSKKVVTITIKNKVEDYFLIGIICEFDKNLVVLNELNTLAVPIRKRKIKINTISSFTYNDIYGNDLEFLYNTASENKIVKTKYLKSKKSIIKELELLIKSKEIISIIINGEYFIGSVLKFNETIITLLSITFQGLEDGIVLLPLDLVSTIRKLGPIEVKVNLLHKRDKTSTF